MSGDFSGLGSSAAEIAPRVLGQFGPVWSFACKQGYRESRRLWVRSSVDQTHVFSVKIRPSAIGYGIL